MEKKCLERRVGGSHLASERGRAQASRSIAEVQPVESDGDEGVTAAEAYQEYLKEKDQVDNVI